MFGWALLVASPVLTLGATLHVTGETARIIFNEVEPWAEGGVDGGEWHCVRGDRRRRLRMQHASIEPN